MECRTCAHWRPKFGKVGQCKKNKNILTRRDASCELYEVRRVAFESVEEFLARGGEIKECPNVRETDYEMSKPSDKRDPRFRNYLRWGSKAPKL